MKMSDKIEKAYLSLEEVRAEMRVKQMEGLNYQKEMDFLSTILAPVVRLKQALRERGQ